MAAKFSNEQEIQKLQWKTKVCKNDAASLSLSMKIAFVREF